MERFLEVEYKRLQSGRISSLRGHDVQGRGYPPVTRWSHSRNDERYRIIDGRTNNTLIPHDSQLQGVVLSRAHRGETTPLLPHGRYWVYYKVRENLDPEQESVFILHISEPTEGVFLAPPPVRGTYYEVQRGVKETEVYALTVQGFTGQTPHFDYNYAFLTLYYSRELL